MGEIIDRTKLRIRMSLGQVTSSVGFKPNTAQIAEAHSTLDALRRARAINDHQEAGLRDVVRQTEVRDPNINVGALSRIGSQRIQELYSSLTSSQNRNRLSEDDLGALQYAARLTQEAEAQASKSNSIPRYNRRGIIRGGLAVAGLSILGTELVIALPPSAEPPPRLPEAIVVKDLTTEPTPKSPTGWSARLFDNSTYSYVPFNSYGKLVENSERDFQTLSASDIRLAIHQNPDGSLNPALEMENEIDYRDVTVRWVIRDHHQIIVANGPHPSPFAYQFLVLSNLTSEEKGEVLKNQTAEAKAAGFTLDAYLRNKALLVRWYITR